MVDCKKCYVLCCERKRSLADHVQIWLYWAREDSLKSRNDVWVNLKNMFMCNFWFQSCFHLWRSEAEEKPSCDIGRRQHVSLCNKFVIYIPPTGCETEPGFTHEHLIQTRMFKYQTQQWSGTRVKLAVTLLSGQTGSDSWASVSPSTSQTSPR